MFIVLLIDFCPTVMPSTLGVLDLPKALLYGEAIWLLLSDCRMCSYMVVSMELRPPSRMPFIAVAVIGPLLISS